MFLRLYVYIILYILFSLAFLLRMQWACRSIRVYVVAIKAVHFAFPAVRQCSNIVFINFIAIYFFDLCNVMLLARFA